MIRNPHLLSLGEGLLVAFLWSTSYILVKIGLKDLPPLTFSAYRYVLAFLALSTLSLLRGGPKGARVQLSPLLLAGMGLLGYTIAQGLQYVGLLYLPAVTVTFLLNFTPVIVLILEVVALERRPSGWQLLGALVALAGAAIFFSVPLSSLENSGVLFVIASGLGWAAYMTITRKISLGREIDLLKLTRISMGYGSLFLLVSSVLTEGVVFPTASEWLIIIWLAIVNTALAFYMWNHALSNVGAFELSVLQNTMLIQIGVMAVVFLGEELTFLKLVGMSLVFVGVLMVQLVGLKSEPRRSRA